MKVSRILIFLITTIVSSLAHTQTLRTKYEVGGAWGYGSYTPMRHFSNRQGLGNHKINWTYANVGIGGEHTFSKSGIRLDWGTEVTD